MTDKRFPVSEIYGPVVQGEGPLTGRPTVFLRMGGCDYRCSWCDSLYAVEAKYAKTWEKLTATDIVGRLEACLPDGVEDYAKHVTISGGNPAMYDLEPILEALGYKHWRTAIETQGSKSPAWLDRLHDVIVSPKPPSSGNITPIGAGSAFRDIAERHFAHAIGWETFAVKIVVFDQRDFDYAKNVHLSYGWIPMWLQVGTDVGNDSVDELLDKCRILQDMVIRDPAMFDCHVGLQTHVLLHGHRRGI